MAHRAWISLSLLALAVACTREGTVGIVQLHGATSIGSGSDDGPRETEGDRLDLPDGDPEACTARGESMAPCTPDDRPEAFEAVVQWAWTGPDGDTDTLVIPLVASLTDDDRSGRIDLCDTPDVLVAAGPPPPSSLALGIPPARLYALDGATGALHWGSERRIRASVTPALGDLDGDGTIEIVALAPADDPDVAPFPSRLIVFESDGSVALTGTEVFESTGADAVALADLDADGDAEIMVADRVFDHEGRVLLVATDVGAELREPLMPFGVDLDLDGDLEVLWARAAYHHDGTPLFSGLGLRQGYAQVANLDDDPEPEIVMTTAEGLAVVEADGTVVQVDVRPIDLPGSSAGWRRPAAIHDIDGDRRPEVLVSAGAQLLALRLSTDGSLESVWPAPPTIVDAGWAAGTAFDFLGDGTAEAIYADEQELYAFDELGLPVLMAGRSSITLQEYPVVADVDDDGSAEIVVGSNVGSGSTGYSTVVVYGEANDRWVQARRIWNQHTYHVTNIREDGSLPAPEAPHWQRTNTFRTNAQLEGGLVCVPEP